MNKETTEQYLLRLGAMDVQVWLEGSRVRVSAPKDAAIPGLREELAARKEEIVVFLRSVEDVSRPAGTEVEPILFSGDGQTLYGCLHPPQSTSKPGSGVIICQPVGQEYVRCHRAIRRLASLLARAGFTVLRFDYYGCGDSLGETEDATLSRWLEDVHDAVKLLRTRFRVNRVTLLGVRLGAALAMRVGAEREVVERLVLWDPVVRGLDFLGVMRDQNVELEHRLVALLGPRPESLEPDGPRDLFGFRYGQQMLDEIAGLDLLQISNPPAREVLILDNGMDPAAELLCNRLAALDSNVTLERIAAAKVWMSDPYLRLVPHQSLSFLSDWLGKTG